MHARDQGSIFSTGKKFRPDYMGFYWSSIHSLTLVAHSYALLTSIYSQVFTTFIACNTSKFHTVSTNA